MRLNGNEMYLRIEMPMTMATIIISSAIILLFSSTKKLQKTIRDEILIWNLQKKSLLKKVYIMQTD